MKLKRDRLRKKAELSKKPADVRLWRKQAAIFKGNILREKRCTFNEFISNINYREDSLKTYRFISNLQNYRTISPKKQPIRYQNRDLSSDMEVANAFAQTYSNSQRKRPYSRKMSKIHKSECKNLSGLLNRNTLEIENIFRLPFTEDELFTVLNGLKTRKSPGEDNIHAEFLKHIGIGRIGKNI